MAVKTTRGFLTVLKIVILCAIWIQVISAGGSMQISLISYIFSYESGEHTVKPFANLTVAADYVTSYKPRWRLSGVADPDKRFSDVSSKTPLNNSVEEWPWIGAVECSGTTQYRFIICLDYKKSYDPQRPCTLQRIQTAPITIDRANMPPSAIGGESITFGSYILGAGDNPSIITNPLRLEFPDWKDSVRISVFVNCCGENPQYTGQCNEIVFGTMDLWPRPFLAGSWSVRSRLSGRGSLMMSINMNCDLDYYLSTCDVFCRVDNPATEHMFCNSSSGRKQCVAGWSGSDCQIDVNECRNPVCQNGGTCENRPGSFFCSCMLGTRGRFCEQRVPVCHLKPCQNSGSCLDTPHGFFCACAPGFNGQVCQMEMNERINLLTQTVETSTRVSAILPPTSLASVLVSVELSRVSTNKTDVRWHDWYLAVIFGSLFLLVLIIAIVILHRIKLRNGYKVSLLLLSPGKSNTPTSEQQQSDSFNNDVYQIDKSINISQSNLHHGFNSVNEVNIMDYPHDNECEVNAEKLHISEKASVSSKSKEHTATSMSLNQGNESLTNDSHDYIHKPSAALDIPYARKVTFSLLAPTQINTGKNKLKNVINQTTFHREQHKVQCYAKGNADVLLPKSDKEHSKGAYAVSTFLKPPEPSTDCDIHVEHSTQNVNDSELHNGNDEHIYEEIDAERRPQMFNSTMKPPFVSWSNGGYDLSRSGAVHIIDNSTSTLYPGGVDEHGYLRPRDLLAATCVDFNECTETNEGIALSNVYDFPKLTDGNPRVSKNNAFPISTPPYRSLSQKDNAASLPQTDPITTKCKSNCQDNAVLLNCPESQHYSAICESIDQVNQNPIYANINLV